MKKIALVNQRYGKEVIGGSEYYTMLLAQKLKKKYEVEVLTSKALTYDYWDDYYVNDIEFIDEIKVRRFGVKKKRNKIIQKILGKLTVWFHVNFVWLNRLWLKAQGPYIPELVQFVKENKEAYDVFVFVTYLYYPTVYGMPQVRDKAVFIPTAHDEDYIHFKIYKEIFQMPKAFLFLTEEEKEFVHKKFHNEKIPFEVAGVGVDIPEGVDEKEFCDKYGIEGKYLIYVGRVDKDKGCKEMLEYFCRSSDSHPGLKLVIAGKAYMDIPQRDDVLYLGFISEKDKFEGIKGAEALWLPSQCESLSIAVLEAMSLEKPVIVNGKSEILKGHCDKSGGGMSYTSYEEFLKCLSALMGENYKKMCFCAGKYIETNYRWESVIARWDALLDLI